MAGRRILPPGCTAGYPWFRLTARVEHPWQVVGVSGSGLSSWVVWLAAAWWLPLEIVLWWGLALSDGGCQWRCGGGGVKILSNLGLGLGFSVFGLICCIWSFGPIGFYALYCFIRACKALRCLGFGPLGLCCIVISGRFRPSGVWALSLR